MRPVILLALLAGCPGGPCEYAKTAGTCTITQLGHATPSPSPGTDANDTLFSFTPTGATAPTANSTLIISNSPTGNPTPTAACLQANHITLGTMLPCTFMKETSGTCTPQVYEIPGFNQMAPGCP
jgi:hypothetical protein